MDGGSRVNVMGLKPGFHQCETGWMRGNEIVNFILRQVGAISADANSIAGGVIGLCLDLPLMRGVANLVQGGYEFVEPVLLKAYVQVQDMVRRGFSIQLPTSRYIRPGVLDFYFAPSLEGLGKADLYEPEKETG